MNYMTASYRELILSHLIIQGGCRAQGSCHGRAPHEGASEHVDVGEGVLGDAGVHVATVAHLDAAQLILGMHLEQKNRVLSFLTPFRSCELGKTRSLVYFISPRIPSYIILKD